MFLHACLEFTMLFIFKATNVKSLKSGNNKQFSKESLCQVTGGNVNISVYIRDMLIVLRGEAAWPRFVG